MRKQINTKIESTTDYSQFKNIRGNRLLMVKHIKNLVRSLVKRNFLAENPILVNEKMEVIDGQHRLAAAMELQLPIYYIVIDDIGLVEVQQLNTTNASWKPVDFLHSYCALGKEQYLQFRDLIEAYKFPIKNGIQLILGNTGGRSNGSAYLYFKEGRLSFTSKQLEEAYKKADLMSELNTFFIDGSNTSIHYFTAFDYVYKQGYGEKLVSKAKLSKPKLARRYNRREFIRQLEDVLNYHVKTNLIRLI